MPERSTGRGAVTAVTGVGVLLAALSLLPVVYGALWWIESVVTVVVALAAAAASRRVGLTSGAAALIGLTSIPIVLALIVAGSTVTITTPQGAALGVVDGFSTAFRQIYLDTVPAQGTAALALLIASGAAVVAVVADFVTVGLRAPVAGTLVIVAVAIVPGKAFATGTNGFLLLAVAAAALGVIAADRRRRGRAPRIAGLAAGGAVAVVVALVVQIVLPTPFSSQAAIAGAPVIDSGANPLLRLGQDLRRGASTPVLSYTSRNDQPVYLRLAVLEDFTGQTWAPNPPDGRPLGLGSTPQAPGVAVSADTNTTSTTITPASDVAIGDRLPLPYPAVAVQGVSGRFRWEEKGLTLARFGGGAVGTYTVRSADIAATPTQLRDASVSVPAGDEQSLELPSDVPSIIRRTAARWVASAQTPYDMAVAIQNQLRNGSFSYDEDTPAEQGYDGDGLGVIAKFLQVKAGYCIHFASTMAVMARIEGIPARIVVGYQPGETQADTRAHRVSSDDLHAWPELYFDGVGWVRFEPTPGRGAVPAYAPLPSASVSTTPTAAPSTEAAATPQPTESDPAAARSGDRGGASLVPLLRGSGVALIVLALLALPGLLRRGLRRRRIGRLGRDGPAGAWREILDTAVDLGLPTGRGRSPRGIEAVVAEQVGSTPGAREALGRLRAAYERQAYSRDVAAATEADVALVLRALRAHASGGRRFAAAVAPRSLAGTLVPPRLAFRWSPPGSG
ncbi:transglutaminase superfamily protein [Amnibacterium kyonggiense]|uniref:Transglutaminase superfamily protein n=1 Tax=Amnibacterium kyonggiense TaxID=595671 RepID=A0A4R7FQZ4_9MICO|nr:transglutaminase superfamily protein [Amnibacterium kyonggiense]